VLGSILFTFCTYKERKRQKWVDLLFNCEAAVRTKEKGNKVQTEKIRIRRKKGNLKNSK